MKLKHIKFKKLCRQQKAPRSYKKVGPAPLPVHFILYKKKKDSTQEEH